jgi:hypothetical protein
MDQYRRIREELRDEMRREVEDELQNPELERSRSARQKKKRNNSSLPFLVPEHNHSKKCSCEFPKLHAHKPRIVSAWRKANNKSPVGDWQTK